MDDSFAFGKRARRQAAVKRARVSKPGSAEGSRRAGVGRVAVLVAGGIVVVVAIAGAMAFFKDSGEQIASDQRTTVSQIGVAKDVDAKMTIQEATAAVQQLYAEQGSFAAVTPASLERFEPSFSYTGSASTGPKIVGVSSSAGGVGIAVLSDSGTCFYEAFTPSGSTAGSGTTCTGAAALSASSG
jgi:hypothetical protein